MPDTKPVRVVVAHRSPLIRNVLGLLSVPEEVLVVGEARGPWELVGRCNAEHPHVALTEADFEDGTEVETYLPALLGTGARVIAFCDDRSPGRAIAILSRGASGFLRSDTAPSAVVEAVEAVASGAAMLAPAAAGAILDEWRRLRQGVVRGMAMGPPTLTPRETEVLAAMAEGLATKAIAQSLGMALKTVEAHKTHIFDKLGVPTQAAAVSYAIAHGLVPKTVTVYDPDTFASTSF